MSGGIYEACHIKRRRATKAQIQALKDALFGIVAEQRPMSVRQVFYQASCRGLVEKSEAGYARVQRALKTMRLEGDLPFNWIADYTRYRRKPETFDSIQEAIADTAAHYRRALWTNSRDYVEIWCEKEALLGCIYPVTHQYDVPLMIAKGFSSITFLQATALEIEAIGKPAYLYYFGDHDPSGVAIARCIHERLHEFAPAAEIHFVRAAVTPEHIEEYALPMRPTKRTDTRAKHWYGGSVELDALPPDVLREMVRECIERHLDPGELEALARTEAVERESIMAIAAQLEDSDAA